MDFEDIYSLVDASIDGRYAINKENKYAMYERLITLKEPTVLEIGVHSGHTALFLAIVAHQRGGRYIGVDPFIWWPDQDVPREGHVQRLRNVLNQHTARSTIIEADANTLDWDLPLDFLLIDDGHDEENVDAQCRRYLPFVRPGGYAVFDDYDMSLPCGHPHEGVAIAANRYTSTGYENTVIPNMFISRKGV